MNPYPPYNKVVLVHDGDTGKHVKGKRIKHKLFGSIFVEVTDDPNWQKVIENPRAWKETK